MWKMVTTAMVCLGLLGCGGGENLTIADAEAAGFAKDQQQLFQMIGADDGWNGDWAGDSVELYQFSDPASVQTPPATSVQPGNVSGWVEMCVVRNMLMLSKGESACRELEALAG